MQESDKVALTFSLQNALDEIEAYREQVVQLQDKIRDQLKLGEEDKNLPSSKLKHQVSETSESAFLDFKTSKGMEFDTTSTSSGLVLNEELVNKLVAAEQQKEHWILEYQLLKMKFGKLFAVSDTTWYFLRLL